MLYPNSKHKPQPRSRSRDIDSRTSRDNRFKYTESSTPICLNEFKTLSTNPEYIIDEGRNRLLEWVWPVGKQGDTTVLTANRLFGRNDKGFLIVEKAKEIMKPYSLDSIEPMQEVTDFANELQRLYLEKIEEIYNDPVADEWSKITAAEALGMINILNQIDRYKVFNIPKLCLLKEKIWKILTNKTLGKDLKDGNLLESTDEESLLEINTITI